MRRRSNRLAEKAERLSEDEEKVNRRMSAGGVLGLSAPADSKNLEDARALDAAAAAAARLDSYKTQHDKDDDIEEKEADSVSSARARARANLAKPSKDREMRRESVALRENLNDLMEDEDSHSEAGAAAAASASKKKKKKRRKKPNITQWYGVAKGKETGVWFTDFAGIKPLVHGVGTSLYEGFPTKGEAEDFVRDHHDHNEGAKQKSARKARESARKARESARAA